MRLGVYSLENKAVCVEPLWQIKFRISDCLLINYVSVCLSIFLKNLFILSGFITCKNKSQKRLDISFRITYLCNTYTGNATFHGSVNDIFSDESWYYFSYLCSKQRFGQLFRIVSMTTNNNLCLKLRIKMFIPATPTCLNINWGVIWVLIASTC